jgi:hypothetical protein
MKTRHLTCLALALLTTGTVTAYADDAHSVTADELQQILPGASIEFTTDNGNFVRWTNDKDGTLTANLTPGAESGNSHHYSTVGHGTWRVSDAGEFCVHIEWPRSVTDSCRSVGKSDDGTYFLGLKSGAPGWKISVSK